MNNSAGANSILATLVAPATYSVSASCSLFLIHSFFSINRLHTLGCTVKRFRVKSLHLSRLARLNYLGDDFFPHFQVEFVPHWECACSMCPMVASKHLEKILLHCKSRGQPVFLIQNQHLHCCPYKIIVCHWQHLFLVPTNRSKADRSNTFIGTNQRRHDRETDCTLSLQIWPGFESHQGETNFYIFNKKLFDLICFHFLKATSCKCI